MITSPSPLIIKELSARIQSVAEASDKRLRQYSQHPQCSLDPNNHIATKDGAPIKLTPKEFAVLEFFMRNPNKVFKADALLDHIWISEQALDQRRSERA